MAVVPFVTQDSAPLQTQTGRRRVAAGSVAFGAQEAGSIAGLAQNLGQVAEVAEDIDLRFDQANVRELDTALTDSLIEAESAYLNNRGRAALDARPAYQGAIEARVAELTNAARSDRARAAFEDLAATRRSSALERANTHARQELRTYENDLSQARIAQFGRAAAARPDDDLEIRRNLGGLRSEVDAFARRNGMDPAVAEEMYVTEAASAAGQIAEVRAARNPTEVLGAIRAEQREGVYALLTPQQVLRLDADIQRDLQRRAAEYRSNLREQMEIAADRMELGLAPEGGPNVAQVRAAFGDQAAEAWTVRLGAFDESQSQRSMTSAELERIAAAPAPRPENASASDVLLHRSRVESASNLLQQRGEDPMAYIARQTGNIDTEGFLADMQQGDFTALARRLRSRQAIAQEYGRELGMAAQPLTRPEASALRAQLDTLNADQRTAAIAAFRQSITDPRAYANFAGQLYPDAPGAQLGMQVQGRRANIEGARTITGDAAARYLIEGSIALGAVQQQNTTGEEGRDRSRRTLAMPSDGDLRRVWVEEVGDAYRGLPQAEAASFEAFRAAYAGASIEAGDSSGRINESRAKLAARVASGGVTSEGQRRTLLPWGMSEQGFRQSLRDGWQGGIPQRLGGDLVRTDPGDFEYEALGGGRYGVVKPSGAPALDQNGRPVVIVIPGR